VVKQTNTHIVALLRSESEMLAQIQDSFHAMVMARNSRQDNSLHVQHPIDISCFYEELPIPGIGQIVPRESAILPGYISIGIHANHMDMARFRSADDPGFLAVCGELRRWVEAVATTDENPERQPAPAPASAGGLSLLQPSGSGGAPCKIKWACPSHLAFQSFVCVTRLHTIHLPVLVPYTRNAAFTGRSAILDKLHKQPLKSSSQARTALFGLGGIGFVSLFPSGSVILFNLTDDTRNNTGKHR
jgi:hypothetical protein